MNIVLLLNVFHSTVSFIPCIKPQYNSYHIESPAHHIRKVGLAICRYY